MIPDLYAAAEGTRDEFVMFLVAGGLVSAHSLEHSKAVWGIAILNKVVNSPETVHEKLHKAAQFWASLDYPEVWKDFIYYMPAGAQTGEDHLYQNLLKYIGASTQKI